ncbi:MAG: hypothetical protein OXQ29_28385 [Rhodospirillaceae bacterium]|nr:hypothetical protein [Rhodospirillaceae bacterium]
MPAEAAPGGNPGAAVGLPGQRFVLVWIWKRGIVELAASACCLQPDPGEGAVVEADVAWFDGFGAGRWSDTQRVVVHITPGLAASHCPVLGESRPKAAIIG